MRFCGRAFRDVVAQLDQKAQELSEVQKNVVDLRCEVDAERSKWLADKSQLQADLDDALKDRDEERAKAAQLNAEVRRTCKSRDYLYRRHNLLNSANDYVVTFNICLLYLFLSITFYTDRVISHHNGFMFLSVLVYYSTGIVY